MLARGITIHSSKPARTKILAVIAVVVGTSLLISRLVELFFSYQGKGKSLAEFEWEKAKFAAATVEQLIDDVTMRLNDVARHVHAQSGAGLNARRLEYLRLLNHVPSITDVSHLDSAGVEQLKVSRVGLDVIAGGRRRAGDIPFAGLRSGKVYFGPVYFLDEDTPSGHLRRLI